MLCLYISALLCLHQPPCHYPVLTTGIYRHTSSYHLFDVSVPEPLKLTLSIIRRNAVLSFFLCIFLKWSLLVKENVGMTTSAVLNEVLTIMSHLCFINGIFVYFCFILKQPERKCIVIQRVMSLIFPACRCSVSYSNSDCYLEAVFHIKVSAGVIVSGSDEGKHDLFSCSFASVCVECLISLSCVSVINIQSQLIISAAKSTRKNLYCD